MKSCKKKLMLMDIEGADDITYVAKLDDETFAKDVDDKFGVVRR